jgi:hypothetical protein
MDRNMGKTMKVACGLALVLALLAMVGCSPIRRVSHDEVRVLDSDDDERTVSTHDQTVEAEDAEEARVSIEMGAGRLSVFGGTDELMEADFTYSRERWKPEVSYRVRSGEGRLDISQANRPLDLGPDRNDRNDWDLRFGEGLPLTIEVAMGAGQAEFELGDLDLRDFELTMGAGDVYVDLVGDLDHDADVRIQGGAGRLEVRLPSDVGIRADVRGGLGRIEVDGLTKRGSEWVSEDYEDADVLIDVRVEGGVGEVVLEVEE